MSAMEPLLTPRQLAAFLGVRVSTISGWTRNGVIPCVVLHAGKRRRVVRFLQSEIEKWVITRRSTARGDWNKYVRKKDESSEQGKKAPK